VGSAGEIGYSLDYTTAGASSRSVILSYLRHPAMMTILPMFLLKLALALIQNPHSTHHNLLPMDLLSVFHPLEKVGLNPLLHRSQFILR
jgi:hypothetical protein